MSAKCPRCGDSVVLGRYGVCVPCAALCGWDPPCPACHAEDAGHDDTGLSHVATCAGSYHPPTLSSSEQLLRIADLSSKASAAQEEVARAIREHAFHQGRRQACAELAAEFANRRRLANGVDDLQQAAFVWSQAERIARGVPLPEGETQKLTEEKPDV